MILQMHLKHYASNPTDIPMLPACGTIENYVASAPALASEKLVHRIPQTARQHRANRYDDYAS